MSDKCPICTSDDTQLVQNEGEDGVKTKVLRCELCDFNFLETWDDVEYVKSLYEGDKYVFGHNVSDNSDIELKFDEYKNRYEWVKPYFGKDKTLLEIGCGDGKFLDMVRNDVSIVEGVELSPPQVEKIRGKGITCYDTMIDEMNAPRRYDIICMFALLEHVPLVQVFLEKLKSYIHSETMIFIEVPNLNDPLVSGVDVSEFRNFYYRSIHLYYFTPTSLGKLLSKNGFDFKLHTSQQASITNHFHWMFNRSGQPNANHMTSVIPPVDVFDKLPMADILEKVDNCYRQFLEESQMGDLLSAQVKLAVSS